ncbi:ATP-binding protein [Massilia sp. R2A-15]|uniref:PAS domain-containing hybrid sensor histidine kinase/response regulator n=1 Tax=Massilia sp. R2A-15 TaxID=3064278 RepID=UPI0027361A8C|nr:ATP-binding protein [Massilia sp. R2A-15]WLI89784.1 ATP-binding protein [Massilia sp. R2A-15]
MDWAFEQSPDCIKIMGLDGALLAMNRNGMCAMEIDDFSNVLGHKWPVLWPDATRSKVQTAMERALAGEEGHFNAFCPTARGTPKWWDVLVTPIRNGDGHVERLLAVSRDISEVRRAVEAQLELAARLQFTLEATEIGEWDLDLESLAATRTLRHDQCFGYPDGASEWSVDIMLGHVHPQDRALVEAAFHEALKNDRPLRFEARIIWNDNSIHWISVHGSRYRSADRPDRMIGIVSDITDRMRTTEELKEASQRKDEFLAMLAHELRNPLAPISAAAQILTLGRADAALTLKAGTIIDRQARHMNRLLDDLLDVSRVTQGLVTLSMMRLDLKRVIADAVEQARPMIEQNQHHFSVQLDPAQAFALGDDKRLVQVLANLLNNAAKYTPRGGNIALRLRCKGGFAHISVKDDGIGMDSATLENAFELFSQAARSSDRTTGGLGLGLALVKSLVDRHDGSVTGHSAGKGMGSEFEVRLPLLAAGPAVSNDEAARVPAGSRLRLLIVDDNRDAAETLGMVLGADGHEIHIAFAGQDAIDSAAAIRPDACLLDVGLPDMSGYELARRLRALPETRDASMIAVTGYGSKNDREHSVHAGIDHHLTKPVDTTLLKQALAAIAPKVTN